jgi:hypothetical protein
VRTLARAELDAGAVAVDHRLDRGSTSPHHDVGAVVVERADRDRRRHGRVDRQRAAGHREAPARGGAPVGGRGRVDADRAARHARRGAITAGEGELGAARHLEDGAAAEIQERARAGRGAELVIAGELGARHHRDAVGASDATPLRRGIDGTGGSLDGAHDHRPGRGRRGRGRGAAAREAGAGEQDQREQRLAEANKGSMGHAAPPRALGVLRLRPGRRPRPG